VWSGDARCIAVGKMAASEPLEMRRAQYHSRQPLYPSRRSRWV